VWHSKDITEWHNANIFEWHVNHEIWPVIDFGNWYEDFETWQELNIFTTHLKE